MEKETLKKVLDVNKKLEYAEKKINQLADKELYCVRLFIDSPSTDYAESYDIKDRELLEFISKTVTDFYKNLEKKQESRLAEL